LAVSVRQATYPVSLATIRQLAESRRASRHGAIFQITAKDEFVLVAGPDSYRDVQSRNDPLSK